MKVFGQLENAQLENTTADASSQAKGMITYRSDLNVAKVSDGATFREIVDTDTAQTLSNKTLATPVIFAYATAGNLPTAGNAGTLAYVTNDGAIYYDDGSIWRIISSSSIVEDTLTNLQAAVLSVGQIVYATDTKGLYYYNGVSLIALSPTKNRQTTVLSGLGNFTVPAEVTYLTIYSNYTRNNVLFAGGSHSLGITTNGQVYSWGLNSSGQLGSGTVTARSSPVAIVGAYSFKAISAGGAFTVALDTSGAAWAWGANGANGTLGDGTIIPKSSPVAVIGPTFKAISCGDVHSIGLDDNNEAWAWGNGSNGRLGTGFTTSETIPTAVIGGHSFVSIAAGGTHSLALKANGEVWAWGNNFEGQIGDGTSLNNRTTPVQVVGGHSFVAIAAGYEFSLALKANGEAWAWGNNFSGQLGTGNNTYYSSPVQVIGSYSFVKISAGYRHAIALEADGTAYAWGLNSNGQLGDNSITSRSSPVLVSGGVKFTAIAGGGFTNGFSLGVAYNGRMYAWGINTAGQLGTNNITPRSVPTLVAGSFSFSLLGPTVLRHVLSVTPGQVIPYRATSGINYFGGIVIPEDVTEILVDYMA